MDSTAVNYDEHATTNTNSWCIPALEGCMMPPVGATGPHYTPKDDRLHDKDGITISWDPTATVPGDCENYRLGCMEPAATNYDSYATVAGECVDRVKGCLNRNAKNFNCQDRQGTPCETSVAVTDHQAHLCLYDFFSPPPPPPAPRYPGQYNEPKALETLGGKMLFTGPADTCDDRVAIAQSLADALTAQGDDSPLVLRADCRTASGGVFMEYQFGFEAANERDAAIKHLTAAEENLPLAVNSFLALLATSSSRRALAVTDGLIITDYTAVDAGIVMYVPPETAPAPPPAGFNAGEITGIVFGALAGAALIGGLIFVLVKKAGGGGKKAVTPEY